MRLSELAAELPGAVVEAGTDYEVRRVVQDSRQAGPGDLFVAVRGLQRDGHDFAAAAAGRGAAVALERPLPLPPQTAVLRVADSRRALAELAAVLLGRPARRLLVLGVTGTDGKTTVTHMAAHVLERCGLSVGLLSTVAHGVPSAPQENASGLTTLGAPEVQEQLASMVRAGLRAAVVEASSHALDQERVAACEFDVVAVTNVGHDHLDYHGSWERYLEAKARLIALCAAAAPKGVPKTAVLNADDPCLGHLVGRPVERRLTWSRRAAEADLVACEVRLDASGSSFSLRFAGEQAPVRLRLVGGFNVANALCAAGLCLALGMFHVEQVAAALSSFPGVRGRLERVDLGQPFAVYVDFAHSASGLATVLSELRALTRGRLLAVFGATARSDHDRPGMGRAASQGADYFVITSDDPLDHDPAAIAAEVESGVVGKRQGRDYEVVLDRRAAIRRALTLARPGDVVLLAGKGHERTMLVAEGPLPWDERAEAEAALVELGLAAGRS